MSVLDMISGDLKPTKTYARRAWVWVPASPGDYPDGREGTLTIILQHSRRTGAKQESDTYGVDFEYPAPAMPGVTFLLVNDTDPDQPDVYRCTVADRELESRCSCMAGRCWIGCKHVDALRAVLDEGGFANGGSSNGD